MTVEEDRNGNVWAWWMPAGWIGDPDGRLRHRLPSGLGAGWRRVRRTARHRVGVRRDRPARRARGRARGSRSRSSPSPTRRAAASAWPASAPSCPPARVTAERALALRDADGTTLAEALRAAGRDPDAPRRRSHAWSSGSGSTSSCTSSRAAHWIWWTGPSPWRRRSGRTADGSFTLPRRGQPRGHHAAGRPPRSDAGVRVDGARRPRPGHRARRRRDVRQARRHAQRRQRDSARSWRPGSTRGPPTRTRWPRWSRRSPPTRPDSPRATGSRWRSTSNPSARPSSFPISRGSASCARSRRWARSRCCRPQAGHDAGVLSATVPTAMLFVRNPTGISHSPDEYAEIADCSDRRRGAGRRDGRLGDRVSGRVVV